MTACSAPWVAAFASSLQGTVSRVEVHQINAQGNLILRVWPIKLPMRASELRTSLKHLLPPGWTLNVIIPPVKRTDIPIRKGGAAYRHPYFSIEVTMPQEVGQATS